MTTRTLIRTVLAIAMTALVVGLLIWQDQRFTLVRNCEERGGVWDGRAERCRLVPPRRIYIERGLKRT